MDLPPSSKPPGDRKVAQMIVRKGVPALMQCLRAAGLVLGLVNLVGNDDAASSAHAVLTAIINLVKTLLGLQN